MLRLKPQLCPGAWEAPPHRQPGQFSDQLLPPPPPHLQPRSHIHCHLGVHICCSLCWEALPSLIFLPPSCLTSSNVTSSEEASGSCQVAPPPTCDHQPRPCPSSSSGSTSRNHVCTDHAPASLPVPWGPGCTWHAVGTHQGYLRARVTREAAAALRAGLDCSGFEVKLAQRPAMWPWEVISNLPKHQFSRP